MTLLNKIPRKCLLCDFPTHSETFCETCLFDLPKLGRVCEQCALPLGIIESSICGSCLMTPPPWQKLRCPLPYQAPIDSVLKRLKYNGEIVIAAALGNIMAGYLQSFRDKPVDCIVPVPLHPLRYWSRGFNQALELAKPVSKKLQIPIRASLCKRTRMTRDQAALQHGKRQSNVDQAFIANPRAVQGMHIVIIDDVLTTGATMMAVTDCFKACGATVSAWVCARTQVRLSPVGLDNFHALKNPRH